MTNLRKLFFSIAAYLDAKYLGKEEDHSEAIQYRFKRIKSNISRCITYEHTVNCNDMITLWLLAPYGERAMPEIDTLQALLRTKQKSIERRARVRNGEDIINQVFKTA